MNDQVKEREKRPETQEAAGELARSRCRESGAGRAKPSPAQQVWAEWPVPEQRGKERRQVGAGMTLT